MQINTIKELNLHTSKRISEYEFERMDRTERIYRRVIVAVLISPVLVMTLMAIHLGGRHEEEVVFKRVVIPVAPIAEPYGELGSLGIKTTPSYNDHWGPGK